MATPIVPDPDFVVAQKIKPETKTKSGILLGDAATKEPAYVEIVAVGSAIKNRKVGQKVILSDEYGAAKEVTIEDTDYLLVRNDKIIGTLA